MGTVPVTCIVKDGEAVIETEATTELISTAVFVHRTRAKFVICSAYNGEEHT